MLFCLLLIVLLVHATTVVTSQDNSSNNDEQKIINHIFDISHDPFVRPIKQKGDKIVVKVGVTYHQLVDVNEKDQIVTSSIWIRQTWTNPLLKWNKEDFRNMTINADPGQIWKPDLYLYNNADENSDGSQHSFNTKVKISSDGGNLWLAPTILKTACKINVEHFPFDEQFCDITLGSWTYDMLRLDVQLEQSTADTSKFVNNGEWDLISIKGKRRTFKYPCCKFPFAKLTYTIRIRRRTRFYYINLIIPCIVITGLSILAFKVPPDSGERITLVITNLLSMVVFLLLVADILPPISDATPLISIYYTIVMFEIGFALICTCVVLKVNFRHPSHGDMPEWFRNLVLRWMARLFRMTPKVKMAESQKKHFEKAKRKTSIFAAWIPRFSITRLYSTRGSVASGDGSQGSRRRKSLKSVDKSDDVEKSDVNHNDSIAKKQGDKYIALTQINVQDQSGMVQGEGIPIPEGNLDKKNETGELVVIHEGPVENEGSTPQNTYEETMGSSEANGLHDSDDAFEDPLPESEHAEKEKTSNMACVSIASPVNNNIDSEMMCLACSHNSAIHSLVRQQGDLVKYVESLADMARDMEEEEIKKEEWKLAAAVLDEFFFWVYFVMLVISNAVIFSKIPKYKD